MNGFDMNMVIVLGCLIVLGPAWTWWLMTKAGKSHTEAIELLNNTFAKISETDSTVVGSLVDMMKDLTAVVAANPNTDHQVLMTQALATIDRLATTMETKTTWSDPVPASIPGFKTESESERMGTPPGEPSTVDENLQDLDN